MALFSILESPFSVSLGILASFLPGHCTFRLFLKVTYGDVSVLPFVLVQHAIPLLDDSCSLRSPALSEKADRRMCGTLARQMGVKESGQRRNENLSSCSLLGLQGVVVKCRPYLATFWVLSVPHVSWSMTPALQHSMLFLEE